MGPWMEPWDPLLICPCGGRIGLMNLGRNRLLLSPGPEALRAGDHLGELLPGDWAEAVQRGSAGLPSLLSQLIFPWKV